MSNEAARPGPYTDVSLTKRNVTNPDAPTPVPARSGSTTLGETKIYEAAGTNHEPGDQGAVVPPHSPTAWKPGRDPYANGGGVGQDYLNNAGG